MIHKRSAPRIECDARVDFSSPSEMVLDHELENLSLGGACLRSVKVQPVGTPVALVINFPDLGGRTIEIGGEVVWANEEEPRDMGIRFTDLDDEARDLLRMYIAARPL